MELVAKYVRTRDMKYVRPAFDMRPATENLESMFGGYDKDQLSGIDPDRARFCVVMIQKSRSMMQSITRVQPTMRRTTHQ